VFDDGSHYWDRVVPVDEITGGALFPLSSFDFYYFERGSALGAEFIRHFISSEIKKVVIGNFHCWQMIKSNF